MQSSFTPPKRIAIDTNFLVAYLSPSTPDTLREKINYLLRLMDKSKSQFIIPTPVVAEYLVGADFAGLTSLRTLQSKKNIIFGPFDIAAAYEVSLIDGACMSREDKKDGSTSPWQKIKVDRQVIAIAKTLGAELVITMDKDIHKTGLRIGMEVMKIDDLPLPPEAAQGKLDLVTNLPPQSAFTH